MTDSAVQQDPFVAYYEQQSASPKAVAHFQAVRDTLLRMLGRPGDARGVRVADIGCGAGTCSRIWAAGEAVVAGIDVNAALIRIAEERARADARQIDFRVGVATELPWEERSFDVVLMPELLEHVADWRRCLKEAARVLDRDGVLYLSTTNRLCPKQSEFDLPFYSWYPRSIKERCVLRAKSDRRHWVAYAEFPALHWFDAYFLEKELDRLGLQSFDRFQIWSRTSQSALRRALGNAAGLVPPLRFVGHLLTPCTTLVARKRMTS